MRVEQDFPVPEQAGERRVPQLLFTPFRLGNLELKNRLVMSPLGLSLETVESYFHYCLARARGGAGLIILGGNIFQPCSGVMPDIFHPAHGELLERLAGEVHAQGCKFGIQFVHIGRQTSMKTMGIPPVAPSPIPDPVFREMPEVISREGIKALVERFAEAALRAKQLGFDLVEIHAAHGYLLSSFLSPHANQRTDEYGGDAEGRARILLEVIGRIREEVGTDFTLGCRFNGADNYPGGVTTEESKVTARLLEEAGIDYLSVSAGVYGASTVIIAPFYAPVGCYVPLAAEVKKVVRVPVIAVGRINDPWLAEEILASGKADLIAMGRALLADPDLPNKAARGEFDEIRPCLSCNKGCLRFIDTGKPTTCVVNPELGRESEMALVPAVDLRRVLVVGGGLAGLECARVAAARGHEVALYEEDEELGGQWLLASAAPYKEHFSQLTSYLVRQSRKLGVRLELGKRATGEVVAAEKPDVVVIATGAEPVLPNIPGAEREHVLQAWDVLAGRVQTGEQVLVVGGNAVGLETAHFLAVRGKRVTVAEMLGYVGADMVPTVRFHLQRKLSEAGVRLCPETKVMSIEADRVVVTTKDGEQSWEGFDTVVLAVGAKSRNGLRERIKGVVPEIYVIGDAVQPRSSLEAMHEAAEVGRKI